MWMDVRDLSEYLKLKEKTIYYLVSKGVIPCYRIGRLVRFRQDEVDAWMDTKRAKPFKNYLDKIIRTVYTAPEGRPDHLRKEVR
jgi:excisionase family DNA binding protein